MDEFYTNNENNEHTNSLPLRNKKQVQSCAEQCLQDILELFLLKIYKTYGIHLE